MDSTWGEMILEDGDIDEEKLEKCIETLRAMANAKLKEQCVRTEWAAMESALERELLLQVATEDEFWREVDELTQADLEGAPEEADDVDTDARLLQMFKCCDKDNSGTIDANELHQMLLYMGVSATDSEVKEMIRQVDKNGDGDIDEQEFLLVMKAAQAGQLSIAAPTKGNIRRASFRVASRVQIKKAASPTSPHNNTV
jgi:hypothetical protein